MDFREVISNRRSRRGFRPDPIPEESLQHIAEAVAHAPTACNRQPIKILLIKNPAIREKICSVYSRDWLKEAPQIAVAIGNESEAWKRPEGDSILPVDAAIVMEHFILAATAEGLGTCWICAFQRKEMDRVLELENTSWKSIAISPLGFSDAVPRDNTCKPVNQLFEVIE